MDVSDIADFRVWVNVCLLCIHGQRPTFVSKKLFRQHFADWRIKRSQSFHVVPVNDRLFRVTKLLDRRIETVSIAQESVICTCQDYQTQQSIFGNHKACCSHAYRVLNHLGYQRLSHYLQTSKTAEQLTTKYFLLSFIAFTRKMGYNRNIDKAVAPLDK